MSLSKRRRRVKQQNDKKASLVHDEMFDGVKSKVGCQCDEHGDDWIQCTAQDCDVWHCTDNIRAQFLLSDAEFDALQNSNQVFKCILHGFVSMKIGKAMFTFDDEDDKEEDQEATHITSSNNDKNTKKRGLSSSKTDLAPAPKKRKLECTAPLPALEAHNTDNTSNKNTSESHMMDGQNIYSLKKEELKALCAKKGLKVSGTKAELILRLLNPSESKTKRRKNAGIERVHNLLRDAGIEDPERVNPCLKRGIEKGFVTLNMNKNGLDEVICSGRCMLCSKRHDATIRDCLYQNVYGGNDYEEGSHGGAIQCDCQGEEETCGMYVTELCKGRPSFDSGKFHNHCVECPGFGICIGDYREVHCPKCNKHYFCGLSGFECDNCARRGGRGRGVVLGDECVIQ